MSARWRFTTSANTDLADCTRLWLRLLWPDRNSVQWNPADDLCVAADLRIRHAAGHKELLVHSELMAAKYAGGAR